MRDELQRLKKILESWQIFPEICYYDIENSLTVIIRDKPSLDVLHVKAHGHMILSTYHFEAARTDPASMTTEIYVLYWGFSNWLKAIWIQKYGEEHFLYYFDAELTRIVFDYYAAVMDLKFDEYLFSRIESTKLREFLPIPKYYKIPERIESYQDLGFE